MQPELSPALPPYAVLFQIFLGKWAASAVFAGAELGIADHLEAGPKTTQQLADEMGLHEPSLYRLMRTLASISIFQEGDGRLFSQTPLSDALRTNANPSLRSFAMFLNDGWHNRAWGELAWSVKTARPGTEKVFGMPMFDHFSKHPEDAVNFNACMADLSKSDSPNILASYDFSVFDRIVEVGGGSGALLAAILESAPKLRGVLFDLPYVIEQARTAPVLAGYASRCEFEGGSFLDSVPAGADAYIMKHILHDWDDERSARILSNCRKALRPGGKVLVVDRVLGPPNLSDQGKLMDLEMMLLPGGLERTEPEWRELFAASGLRLDRIIPMPAPQSILEATPA